MNVDAICFSQVVEHGLVAIRNLSINAVNREAFGCHIGSIMSLLERHGTSTEVMEVGLATVAIVIIVVIIINVILIIMILILFIIVVISFIMTVVIFLLF